MSVFFLYIKKSYTISYKTTVKGLNWFFRDSCIRVCPNRTPTRFAFHLRCHCLTFSPPESSDRLCYCCCCRYELERECERCFSRLVSELSSLLTCSPIRSSYCCSLLSCPCSRPRLSCSSSGNGLCVPLLVSEVSTLVSSSAYCCYYCCWPILRSGLL